MKMNKVSLIICILILASEISYVNALPPYIIVEPDPTSYGEIVMVTGNYFTSDSNVIVTVGSWLTQPNINANGTGYWTYSFSIPFKLTPQTYTVMIENNKFNPVDLDIKSGDTVTWINKDSAKYTVTFEDARLDQILTSGAKVSYTFTETEEARYFCQFHPGMRGSVKVG